MDPLCTVDTLKIQVRTFIICYFSLKLKGQTEHIHDLGDMFCPMSWFLKLYFFREWIRKTFKLVRYKGVIPSHQRTCGETFKNYKFLENLKNPLGLARKMSKETRWLLTSFMKAELQARME